MPTAVVFGAGGARGAFEIGAARCLTAEYDVAPDIITGVSAGALVGAKLAEGSTTDARLAALDELEEFLHTLHAAEDLFQLRDWLQELRDTPLGRALAGYLSPAKTRSGGARRSVMSHVMPLMTNALRTLITDIPRLRRAIGMFGDHGNSVFSAQPLRRRLRGEDGRPPLIDPAAVAAAGTALRVGVVSLETGDLRFATEHGRLVHRRDIAGEDGIEVDLYEAVLASAAQPILFPPVRLGDETYVDGGVVQIIPLPPAIDLGADTAYVVVASELELAPPPDVGFENADLLTLARRTLNDIPLWENVTRGLNPRDGDGTRVVKIVPSFNVLGVTDVDPGLLSIAADYGYMRAADAVLEVRDAGSPRGRVRSDAITALRRRCWDLENGLRDAAAVDRPALLDDIRTVKWLQSRVVDESLAAGDPMPASTIESHARWERHAEAVDVPPSPWHPGGPDGFVPQHRRIRSDADDGEQGAIWNGVLASVDAVPGTDAGEAPLEIPAAALGWMHDAEVRP